MATNKQASIHTHAVCNAVTLVWGSLRLAPTNKQNDDGKETANFGPGAYGTPMSCSLPTKRFIILCGLDQN